MKSWLEQLERELDARLSAFLRNNPLQEQLFRDQHLQDRAKALQRQRSQLKQEANEQRRQLLQLADDVRGWRQRCNRAHQAGAADLAKRADAHLTRLMQQGRSLWSDLEDLGRRFGEVDRQLEMLSKQKSSGSSNLEADWAQFEAEQELEELRRRSGLNS